MTRIMHTFANFHYTVGMVVPMNVIYLTVDKSVKVIEAGAFRCRTKLKSVVLPEGLESGGAWGIGILRLRISRVHQYTIKC